MSDSLRALHDGVIQRLAAGGDRVAVKDREKTLTFAEVDQISKALGEALNAAGLEPGRLVTLHIPKSVMEYAATLALMRSRIVGLMLAPDISRAQVAAAQQRYPVGLHVVHVSFCRFYENCEERARFDEFVIYAPPKRDGDLPGLPAACAWTLQTSGSTGEPKLVMMTGENLVLRAQGEIRDFPVLENDTIACFLNSSHDLGLNQILSALFANSRLVMHKLIFMIDFVRVLTSENVAGFTAVPSFWNLMMKADVLPLELPALRYVTVSGGSVHPLVWRWIRAVLPHVDIIKTYGQTETFRSLLRHSRPEFNEDYIDALGFPVEGAELRLNSNGVLLHRGSGTMLGYYGEEIVATDGFVVTGDTFVFDPKHGFSFQGRQDDMKKVNGLRFYPVTLERILTEHPAVVESMVTVMEGDILVAVVAASGVVPLEIQAFVAERAPRGLIPTEVLVVEALPKTGSGKIDRVQVEREIHSFLMTKTRL